MRSIYRGTILQTCTYSTARIGFVTMKTIKEIKDHFSIEEIKLLIEIVRGRQDFDIMETAIRDFYSDEYEPNQKSYDYLYTFIEMRYFLDMI